MSRRRIGQEAFGFSQESKNGSTLDALLKVIDWEPADRRLATISSAARGEPAVTARLLPRRFCFDASNKLFVVDKSVEEVAPFVG